LRRTAKPPDIRREEIIGTARRLFVTNGFDETSISDIAEGMNTAHGLVYHYFKSKTELLFAVIDEIMKEEVEAMEKVTLKNDRKAADCLKIFLSNEFNESKMKNYGKLFTSVSENQALMEYTKAKMASATERMALDMIERGNRDGSWNCPRPKETADFFLHGVSGIMGIPEQVSIEIISRLLGAET
jgi:AcrR family transcriptional regulator